MDESRAVYGPLRGLHGLEPLRGLQEELNDFAALLSIDSNSEGIQRLRAVLEEQDAAGLALQEGRSRASLYAFLIVVMMVLAVVSADPNLAERLSPELARLLELPHGPAAVALAVVGSLAARHWSGGDS
jgi:hypothetical protein